MIFTEHEVQAGRNRVGEAPSWTFLTNHALVLAYINRRADSTGEQIARAVGITERAARRIIAELRAAGYIEAERIGRRNRYRIDERRPFGRIDGRELPLGELLELLRGSSTGANS